MLPKPAILLFLMLTMVSSTTRAASAPGPADQCRFIGLKDFSQFTTALSTNAGEQILLSPVIKAPIAWDELIVSWNAETPPGAWLKVEAQGIYPDHKTRFYTMGVWSTDTAKHPRGSVGRQRDADGRVNQDTLVLKKPGPDLQLRVTLAGDGPVAPPRLKFLGISLLDSKASPAPLPADRAVWGKIVETTERSQHSYPQEKGWCSPTSLSMVLSRWGGLLKRPELEVDVPAVAAGVYDPGFHGTGNWPFNTAFAGEFPGMRAYVTRFSDIAELEDWIATGIPVIISAPWHLLLPGRHDTGAGHLTVCIGFTENGDVVINDPATNLQKGQKVRHIYKRENVIKAWKESGNTVYLVYPENTKLPADPYGHWDKP
jgi:hypothetical protein